MKKIICRVIERLFPEQVAKIRETNRARRAAIQVLLNVSGGLRRSGCTTSETNRALRSALSAYELGDYEHVHERAERAAIANG